MIASQTRQTLGDLVIRGELDGFEQGLPFRDCPDCGLPMGRFYYLRPKSLLRRESVKVVYQCRDSFCGHAEVLG